MDVSNIRTYRRDRLVYNTLTLNKSVAARVTLV